MNDTTTAAGAAPASPRDKLMADLKVVIADAEELLRLTTGQAGDRVGELRQRIEERLATARAQLSLLQVQAARTAREAGQAADQYVHEHPWKAIGIAAGAGLVLGLLLGRR